MLAGEYQTWMKLGFKSVESLLAGQILRPNPYISEERVRSALVDGLEHSMPAQAHRVRVEANVGWNGSPCWHTPAHGGPGQGRIIQHDVQILPDNDSGLVCEVKWLKQQKAAEIARDIWKLALSRSTVNETAAVRTFLLVGGEKGSHDRFRQTINNLDNHGLTLRYSPQGRHSGRLPPARAIQLQDLASTQWGRNQLRTLLAWGSPSHVRTPPPCRKTLRVATRAYWIARAHGRTWRLVLWELDSLGYQGAPIDWNTIRSNLTFSC